MGICHGCVPLELSEKELAHRDNRTDRMLIYGRVPLMITANCVAKHAGRCSKKEFREREIHYTRKQSRDSGKALEPSLYYLRDRKGMEFPVYCDCANCTNILYNALPTDLLDILPRVLALSPETIELSFTTENAAEVTSTLNRLADALGKCDPSASKERTRNGCGAPEKTVVRDTSAPSRSGAFTRGHFTRPVL